MTRPVHAHHLADLAVVMGGGGARAAYQVGVLRAIARRRPELRVPYITGVSAGAINAAHLAAHPGNLRESVDALCALWSNLRVEHVFRVDAPSLATQLLRAALSLVAGGTPVAPRIQGFVDTQPLRTFLGRALQAPHGPIPGIAANLERGTLRAVALSTSSYTTGQSVTWVQGEEIREWQTPQRRAVTRPLSVEHVMASAALPLFFPAVRLDDGWYGDGSIRLAAPLSPALHLGARRLLAISTRYVRGADDPSVHDLPIYPQPAQIAGVLFNSIFLDLLDQDVRRLERINELIERLPDPERHGMQQIRLFTLRPSRDLGRLAGTYEPQLPRIFRFLTRSLGSRSTRSPDFISFLLFQPDYLRALIELGEEDAESRSDELDAFLASD